MADSWTFRAAVRWSRRGQTLQAGEYRFADAASPHDIVERLARGDVHTIAITFPEGLTIDEMAGVFSRVSWAPRSRSAKRHAT